MGTLHNDQYIFLTHVLRMMNISEKPSKESEYTYFMFNNFLRNSWPLWDNLEKFGAAGRATDDNV